MILVDVRVLAHDVASDYVARIAGLDTLVFVSPVSLDDVEFEFGLNAPLVQPSKSSTLSDAEIWIRVFQEYGFSTVLITADDVALASSYVVDAEQQPTVKILYNQDTDRLEVF